MDAAEDAIRIAELQESVLDKVSTPGDDRNALVRGYWAGAVVMLGVTLEKTDAEILAGLSTELGPDSQR
jgi:hypothetical protein